MLAAIGVDSIEELFAQIPEDIRLNRPLDLEDGMSESEVYRFLAGLADTNLDAERIPSFLGAGMYDHYVPAIVEATRADCSRSSQRKLRGRRGGSREGSRGVWSRVTKPKKAHSWTARLTRRRRTSASGTVRHDV